MVLWISTSDKGEGSSRQRTQFAVFEKWSMNRQGGRKRASWTDAGEKRALGLGTASGEDRSRAPPQMAQQAITPTLCRAVCQAQGTTCR